jgi:hypothetical protein
MDPTPQVLRDLALALAKLTGGKAVPDILAGADQEPDVRERITSLAVLLTDDQVERFCRSMRETVEADLNS